jgi:hypothetical protein
MEHKLEPSALQDLQFYWTSTSPLQLQQFIQEQGTREQRRTTYPSMAGSHFGIRTKGCTLRYQFRRRYLLTYQSTTAIGNPDVLRLFSNSREESIMGGAEHSTAKPAAVCRFHCSGQRETLQHALYGPCTLRLGLGRLAPSSLWCFPFLFHIWKISHYRFFRQKLQKYNYQRISTNP